MGEIIEISGFDRPELKPYLGLGERELYHYYEPEEGLFIAESPNVIRRAIEAGYRPESFLLERKHIEGEAAGILRMCPDVPVFTAPVEVMSRITGYPMTRGALCAMRRTLLPAPQEVLRGKKRIAVLEEVVNPTNLGAIFRSAAALGIEAVLLSGGCADPLQRRCSRVSMGTIFQVPWTYWSKSERGERARRTNCRLSWPEEGMEYLRREGFTTLAMALKKDSLTIDDPVLKTKDKLAIILGTEGDGLAAQTIASCDYTVIIPMFHGVDSLNVAAAGAVAFWELAGRGQS